MLTESVSIGSRLTFPLSFLLVNIPFYPFALVKHLISMRLFMLAQHEDWKGWTALHCAAEQGQDEAWPGMAHVL